MAGSVFIIVVIVKYAWKIRLDFLSEALSLKLPFGINKLCIDMLKRELNNKIISILDIGCGCGQFKIFRKFNSIGCDIFSESLEIARKNNNYKKFIKIDIRNLTFTLNSFDAVTCLRVIEHLSKEDGIKLIENMEKIARKKIIIVTPWGYDTSKGGHFSKENSYQIHLSGWTPKEFEERGYKTYPMRTMRWKYGSEYLNLIVNYLLTVIFQPLIKLFPSKLCRDFYAIKEK